MSDIINLRCKGKYRCMADPLFYLPGFSCYSHVKLTTDLLVLAKPNQSNRRSDVIEYYLPRYVSILLLGNVQHNFFTTPCSIHRSNLSSKTTSPALCTFACPVSLHRALAQIANLCCSMSAFETDRIRIQILRTDTIRNSNRHRKREHSRQGLFQPEEWSSKGES